MSDKIMSVRSVIKYLCLTSHQQLWSYGDMLTNVLFYLSKKKKIYVNLVHTCSYYTTIVS